MGLMKSHKLMLAIGLAFTVWYHLNKKAKAANVQEREDADVTAFQAKGL